MLVASQWIVSLFGVVIVLLSAWGAAFPGPLTRMVRHAMNSGWGMPLAVAVRLVLGLSLLFAAPASKFVIAFQALGWLGLVSAIVLPVIGRRRVASLIERFQALPKPVVRAWLSIGVLFGAFILYGV